MTAFRDDFKAKFGPTVMVKYDLIQVSLILSSIYQIALSNNVVKIGNDNITTQITTANNYIRTQIPAINNAIATVEAKIASTPALFANYKDKIDNVLNKIKAWINANTANLLIKNRDELGVFLDQVDETYTVNMLTGKGIKSLFRGTTRRGTDNALFPGSTSTQENGIPTSVDPVKATIFAIESQTYCARNYPEYNKASVIIGLPDNFVGIKCASPSRRVFEELEVAIGTSANNYANVSSVEISVDNARKLVKSLYGITLPATLSRAEADALMFNRVYESPSLDKSFLFYQKSIPFNIK